MKRALGLIFGLMLAGTAAGFVIGNRRRVGLAGVREQVPESIRKHIDAEIDDAEARARRAGAQGELKFIGAGQEGIVMCDDAGQAFKVARGGGDLSDEAAWLAAAGKISGVKEHVARGARYDGVNHVLVRECVKPSKVDRPRMNERKLFDLHMRIAKTMKPYGWGRPEYKPDSYVYTRDRGPVLVDAGFAPLHGRELVRDVLNVVNGRRAVKKDEPRDLAFALRWERGDTVPTEVANRLIKRLQLIDPSVEL